MNLQEMECEDVGRILVAQNSVQWRVFVSTVMNRFR